jgi:hypothetical protein
MDLLTRLQSLGAASAEVLEERAQCGQSLVAGGRAVVPVPLHVAQEAEHAFEANISQLQPTDRPTRILRDKR